MKNKFAQYLVLAMLIVMFLIGLVRYLTPKTFIAETNYNTFILPKNLPRPEQNFSIHKTVNLNSWNKEQLLAARTKAVLKSELAPDYIPADVVFGRIADQVPWWSTNEFFLSGKKRAKIPGDLSQESRGILNPLVLLYPEFWGLTTWTESGFTWKQQYLESPKVMQELPVPYPQLFAINAFKASNTIEAHFDISGFIEAANPFLEKPIETGMLDFGVSGYNARDFNFRYVQLNIEQSENISAPNYDSSILKNNDYLGKVEKLCYLDSPCNHRTQLLHSLDGIKISALPAKAVFNLWSWDKKEQQKSPDLIFILVFN